MKKSTNQSSPLSTQQWLAYEEFVSIFRSNLRRIAYRTQGEYELGDVESEALLMALRMRDTQGFVLDFNDAGFRDTLLRYLYQHLVRYSDTTVRYSVRLDQLEDEEIMPKHIASKLASDEGHNPLAILIAKEAALGVDGNAANHPSLAAAYVRLLEHFNSHMVSVASHLLLSISHTYKRISHARVLAVHQQPLTLPLPSDTFIPGPWRKFKLRRPQVQLAFDFEEAQALPVGP